jgi:hypothetical protein
MIINVCGFGWSGSGAYIDLLREYDEITFPSKRNWEFNLLWAPDGLYDLEHKLCNKHCRIYDSALAIDRFLAVAKEYSGHIFRYDNVLGTSFYKLCEEYINELVQFRLEGNTLIHRLHPTNKDRIFYRYNWFLSRLLRNSLFRREDVYKKLRINNYKKMQVSYNPDNFVEATQRFVESLLDRVRDDKTKALVLDQSFPPDMPHLFDHFIKEKHKTLVVRRDPRDNFILINELKGITRPVPTKVYDYISFYAKTVEETKLQDDDNLMSINFEDLVYCYDDTVKKIEDFLGIKQHINRHKFFNPNVSINNTQLVQLYPKYSDDIKIIESKLQNSLFHFENYSPIKRNTKVLF